jgi:hypothetical protein
MIFRLEIAITCVLALSASTSAPARDRARAAYPSSLTANGPIPGPVPNSLPGTGSGPFVGILVTPGSSASAAARTLAQLKLSLTEKVEHGLLTVEEATQIYAHYAALLDPYAAGAAPATGDPANDETTVPPRVADTSPEPAPRPPPPTVAPFIPRPVVLVTASPPKPIAQPSAAATLSASGSAALDKLAGMLATRRPKERAPLYSEGGDATTGTTRPDPSPWSGFGSFGRSGAASDVPSGSGVSVVSSGRTGAARRPRAAGKGLAIVSGALDDRKLASFAEGMRGSWSLPKTLDRHLSALRDLYKTGDAMLAEVSPFPGWINWGFGSVLALLCLRAAWQWKRRLAFAAAARRRRAA